MELDPSQFLIQSQNEENYDDDFDEGDISGGPPLLESLVLHHNNSDDIVKVCTIAKIRIRRLTTLSFLASIRQ